MRKLTLLIAGIVLVLSGSAFAFHDAGVAHCNGCHTMHNSENGVLVDPDSPTGNQWLLTDETPSDVCLSCHGTRLGAVFGADPMAPPAEKGSGNFTFLLEDNLYDGHGGGDTLADGSWAHAVDGDAAGHNIVAPSRGVAAEATNATGVGPGGSFPSGDLGCTSCHDPHGNTNFRLLYGGTVADPTSVQDELYDFTAPAPTASGLSIFFGSESNGNHTAYNSGMSEWCGNCHGDIHSSGNLIHPSGTGIGGDIATTYNAYNGTEDQEGGLLASAYLAAVPFEDAAVTTSSTAGPSSGSNVMCLTCHRAHASSAPNAGRWDFSVTLLEEDGLESGSFAITDPYASPNQRSLCNKCHNKDVGDAIH